MSSPFTCTDARNAWRAHWFVLLGAVALVSPVPAAVAASLETLVMPGPVVEGHKDLESNCDNCHTKFDRQSQRGLCLDCHEEIAQEQAASEGFHGLHPAASTAECATCHVEHQGRDADIAGLIPEVFDHNFTDFPLEGQHANTNCVSCHTRDTPYRDAQTDCVSCHSNDEPHQGNLGEDCASCHTESSWGEVEFDHDTETEFALTGKHAKASCSSCHVNEVYENTPSECFDCHKLDDVHQGSRGTECQSCHTTEDWSAPEFDHLAETGFALQGSHQTLTCQNCHLADMEIENPPTTCIGCHSDNDPHLGRNGTECADCHSQQSWDTKFDHEQKTGFALVGNHATLDCSACHLGALTESLPTDCAECHAADDPHAGELGACSTCHGQDRWSDEITFHHDLTNFALLGAHQVTTCEQCHNGLKFAQNSAKACVDCHEDDDVHKSSMGKDCVTCHTPVEWSLWSFDHDTQTDYPLAGAHADLVCESCHTPGRQKSPPTNCISCHRQDDVHRGSFGSNCQRCHSTTTFTDAQVGRGR